MRMRNLEKYRVGGTDTNMKLSLPLPKTPDGRVYRYSPVEDAYPRHFLIGDRVPGTWQEQSPRMKQKPGSSTTVCPYSGKADDDNAFTHPDDIEAAENLVQHAALADVQEALHDMFADLARKTRGNRFARFETGPKPLPPTKPRFQRRDLLRELICDECGRDYGVFAISLYCPDCGAPNIHLHFARESQLVANQVDIAEAQKSTQGELAYRMLGNAHEDVLTAFEATLKTVYQDRLKALPASAPTPKPVKNDFQNIDRARDRFAVFGYDPFAGLDADALTFLTLNIQKRHVIGHNLGIADASFAQHAADARLGETIPLVASEIRRFAEICLMVVADLDTWMAGGTPPPGSAALVPTQLPSRPSPMDDPSEFDGLGWLAVRAGKWISENSLRGLRHGFDEAAFGQAFNDVPERDLAEAIAELEADGLVRTAGVMGRRIPHFHPTNGLFVLFDRATVGNDPSEDAATLIETIIAGGDSVSVEEVFNKVGWSHRRFNPAMALVIEKVGTGRVSGEGSRDFPARSFHLIAADRVELKRYLKRYRG